MYLLCLSNGNFFHIFFFKNIKIKGNYYGLGKIREKELELVGKYLCLFTFYLIININLELQKVDILNKEEL